MLMSNSMQNGLVRLPKKTVCMLMYLGRNNQPPTFKVREDMAIILDTGLALLNLTESSVSGQ